MLEATLATDTNRLGVHALHTAHRISGIHLGKKNVSMGDGEDMVDIDMFLGIIGVGGKVGTVLVGRLTRHTQNADMTAIEDRRLLQEHTDKSQNNT